MRFFNARTQSRKDAKGGKVWKTIISITGLIVAWLTFLGFQITTYANQTDSAPADAAIVLGAGVIDNQPSPVLRERINHALNLYYSGVVSYLIFTDGIGQGDRLAESQVAQKYALEQGIPVDRKTWA